MFRYGCFSKKSDRDTQKGNITMFRYDRASCTSGWPTKKALEQRFVMVTPDEKVVAPPKKTLEQSLVLVVLVEKGAYTNVYRNPILRYTFCGQY